jgi:hypothetical protein
MTADDKLDPVVARELAELEAAFAADLADTRPEPTLAFTTDLDARAAAGFPRRRPFAVARERLRRAPLLIPGVAASGLVAALIAVVVFSGGHSGGDFTSSSGAGAGGGSSSGASSAASQAAAPEADSAAAPNVQRDAAGSASGGSSASSAIAPSPVPVPPSSGGSPRSDSKAKRFVQRSAAITLAARPRDISDTADRIVAVADRLDGFVVSSTVTATNGDGGGGEFVLRVPSDRLQEALAQLSRIGNVRERRQDTTDITREHTSAADRLQEARAERTSLLKRLAKATTDDQTASLRAQLREVDRRIAAAKTALSRVDNRARYANVAVSLVADRHAGGATTGKDDSSWSPGDAAHDALRVLEVAAGVLLIAAAIALPLGLLGALALVLARLSLRRSRERALDAV